MTSSNDTGQGTGSTTAAMDDGLDPRRVRDSSAPGTEAPSDDSADVTSDTSSDETPAASGKNGSVAANQAEPATQDTPAGDNASARSDVFSGDSDGEATGPAGGTVSEKVAEMPETVTPSEGDGVSKPIPGGLFQKAYEAGATAPSSRYAMSASGEEAKKDSPEESSLGFAVASVAAPSAAPSGAAPSSATPSDAASDTADIDDTTRPRNVPRETAAEPPSEAWRRVPAAEADAPSATAGAAPEATAADGDASAGDPAATSVKQGAVRAAQAALAAARSAAKKVQSAMPDTASSSEAAPAADPTNTVPAAPPEMHYAAGAVRGTATVPEQTVPVAPGTPAARPESDTVPGPASAPTPVQRPAAGPRRVRLAISRIDPWSVMKLAFLLSVAIAIMTVVATAVFWSVIDSLGVFNAIQTFVVDAIGAESDVNVMQYVEFERVVSLATLVAICNVVLLTALATILTFLYNITAALVGGVHMTLTDD